MNTKIQTLRNNLAQRIDFFKEEQNKYYILMGALDRFPQLESFADCISFHYDGNSLDFDWLSHERSIEVIKALGGKWNKQLNPGDASTIDYTTEIDGVKFRIYGGQPPPSCKVIEEVVVVPSHYTPETTKVVRRLQCVPEISGSVSE